MNLSDEQADVIALYLIGWADEQQRQAAEDLLRSSDEARSLAERYKQIGRMIEPQTGELPVPADSGRPALARPRTQRRRIRPAIWLLLPASVAASVVLALPLLRPTGSPAAPEPEFVGRMHTFVGASQLSDRRIETQDIDANQEVDFGGRFGRLDLPGAKVWCNARTRLAIGAGGSSIRLDHGRIYVEAAPDGALKEVIVGEHRAQVRGTAVDVLAQADGAAWGCYRGTVAVTGPRLAAQQLQPPEKVWVGPEGVIRRGMHRSEGRPSWVVSIQKDLDTWNR